MAAMDRGARILLAGSLLTAGIATALLFRHPTTRVRTSEITPPALRDGRQTTRPEDLGGRLARRPMVRIENRSPAAAGAAGRSPALVEPMDPGAPPPELSPPYPHAWPESRLRQPRSPAAADPGEGPRPGPVRTHTIVDGDALPDLAQRYLGDAGRFLEIYEANLDRLPSPDLLPIGIELKIPSRVRPAGGPQQSSPPLVPVPRGTLDPSLTTGGP